MKKLTIIILAMVVIALIVAGVYYMRTITGNAIKQNQKVLIRTSEGDITIELYPKEAPITVANFVSYINDGTYNNTVFHRVMKGFMIQGGGFTADGKQKPTKAPIKLESDNGLKNTEGTVAMARTMVSDSATDQFFINAANNNFLNRGFRDEGYAVFGKVVSGMDVVKKIESVTTTTKNGMSDWPTKDVTILEVKLVD